jgi:hypothetical protein
MTEATGGPNLQTIPAWPFSYSHPQMHQQFTSRPTSHFYSKKKASPDSLLLALKARPAFLEGISPRYVVARTPLDLLFHPNRTEDF